MLVALAALLMAPAALAQAKGDAAGEDAAAAGEETGWQRHPWVLEGTFGLGAPSGLAGLMVDYAVTDALSLSGGLGIGSGRHGKWSPQLAIGGRARVPGARHYRWTLELYYSTGSWVAPRLRLVDTGLGSGPPPNPYSPRLHWVMPAVGVDIRRWRDGASLRIYGGLAVPLDSRDVRCGDQNPCQDPEERQKARFPFIAIAFGAAP
jgi:hypothetical protein